MDEYINKQSAFVTLVFSDALGDMTCGQIAKVLDVIKTVPTADVVPVVHGEWVDDGDPLTLVCGVCGYRVMRYNNTKFCHDCGARMDGSEYPAWGRGELP